MVIMGLSTIVTASLLALRLFSLPVSAAPQVPAPSAAVPVAAPEYGVSAADSWWLASIERQGAVAYGGSADYKIFRNVKDYGAKGDGATDDTEAINAAFSDGNRCGYGCDSSTVRPALVYFPPGTYVVSKPILPYYYTHMVGDVQSLPVLKAAAGPRPLHKPKEIR